MRKPSPLLALGGLVLAGLIACGGWALSQTVQTLALSGNEVVVASLGGPGGSSTFVPVYSLRGGCNYQIILAGGTVNATVTPQACKVLVAGAITTLNLQMPTVPYDGQVVAIACPGGTATTVAVTYTPGSLLGTAFTTCTSGGVSPNGAEWVYVAATQTWARIQ